MFPLGLTWHTYTLDWNTLDFPFHHHLFLTHTQQTCDCHVLSLSISPGSARINPAAILSFGAPVARRPPLGAFLTLLKCVVNLAKSPPWRPYWPQFLFAILLQFSNCLQIWPNICCVLLFSRENARLKENFNKNWGCFS